MARLTSDNLGRASTIQVNVSSENHYYRLLEWGDLPDWRQDNEFITTGYRTPSGSFRQSLKSLKYIHNETVNIYSHFLGVLLFLGLVINVLWRLSHYTTIRDIDYIVFTAFFLGMISCFFLSALFHTIANHSESVAACGVQLDYVGIVLLMWGAIIPSVYYGFYCEPNLQKAYWIAVSSVAFACITITVHPSFRSPQLRPYRAVMYTFLGLSAIISMIHGVLIHGWAVQNRRVGLMYAISTAALNIVAAVIYSTRFPERCQPRRFDIYGHSHQLLHIIVVFAGLIYLAGLLRAVDFAHSQTGHCL
jgi:adiponectin receptor